jgi:hypothetical protein
MDLEPVSKNLFVVNHDAASVSEKIDVFKVVEDSNGIPSSLEYMKSF